MLKVKGFISKILFDQDGKVKAVQKNFNLVTDFGLAMIMDQLLSSPTIATPGWMEVGTGSGQGLTDAGLAAPIASSRTALTTKTQLSGVLTMTCIMGPGVGTGDIEEIGTSNSASEDTGLVCYDSAGTSLKKSINDTLTTTWTLTVERA